MGVRTARSTSSVLDPEAILASFGGHRSLIEEIGKMVLAECPQRLSEIEKAITKGEARALEHAAHRLRGSVAQFHPHLLLELLQEMEKSGREGNLTAGEHELNELRAEIDQFATALRDWLAATASDAPAH